MQERRKHTDLVINENIQVLCLCVLDTSLWKTRFQTSSCTQRSVDSSRLCLSAPLSWQKMHSNSTKSWKNFFFKCTCWEFESGAQRQQPSSECKIVAAIGAFFQGWNGVVILCIGHLRWEYWSGSAVGRRSFFEATGMTYQIYSFDPWNIFSLKWELIEISHFYWLNIKEKWKKMTL